LVVASAQVAHHALHHRLLRNGPAHSINAATPTTYAGATQSIYVSGLELRHLECEFGVEICQPDDFTVAHQRSVSYTLGATTNLQAPTFSTGSVAGTVDSTNATVTWYQCGTTCNTGKFGWYANLPGTSGTGSYETDRVQSVLFQQSLIVNSTIPATNSPLSCTTSGKHRQHLCDFRGLRGHVHPNRNDDQDEWFREPTPIPTWSELQTKRERRSDRGEHEGEHHLPHRPVINPVPGSSPGTATPIQLPEQCPG